MVHYLSYYKFTFIFISTRGYFTASFGPFGYALTIGSLFGSLSLLGCWCRLDYGCHNFLFVIAILGLSHKYANELIQNLVPWPKINHGPPADGSMGSPSGWLARLPLAYLFLWHVKLLFVLYTLKETSKEILWRLIWPVLFIIDSTKHNIPWKLMMFWIISYEWSCNWLLRCMSLILSESCDYIKVLMLIAY